MQHELGNAEKPEEIFDIIEHFCLGRRRLHLYGTDATIRPGKYVQCNIFPTKISAYCIHTYLIDIDCVVIPPLHSTRALEVSENHHTL